MIVQPPFFENMKVAQTLIASLDVKTGKSNFDIVDGWDHEAFTKGLAADFPNRFFFMICNKQARKEKAKELFNYTLEE